MARKCVSFVGSLLALLLLSAIDTTMAFADATSNRTVFVQLFQWRWSDIARECETYLGPKGFSAVQISPPQEHPVIPGLPWWLSYQPVSYKIESRMGTRTEFQDMVTRCRAAGVAIYADVVVNHMAAGAAPVGPAPLSPPPIISTTSPTCLRPTSSTGM